MINHLGMAVGLAYNGYGGSILVTETVGVEKDYMIDREGEEGTSLGAGSGGTPLFRH